MFYPENFLSLLEIIYNIFMERFIQGISNRYRKSEGTVTNLLRRVKIMISKMTQCIEKRAMKSITTSLLIKTALCFIGCVLVFSSPSQGCSLAGDVDGNCHLDINDLRLMGQQWLDSGPISANLDGLGDVDYYDFAILAGDWGETEQTGSVTVTISGTIPTGGQWRVDSGGPWYNSGDTASGISVGAHTITFADVAGYGKPADEPVTIPFGGSTTIETLVTMASSVWEYLYDGSDQETAWQAYGFDDGWDSGPGLLGFGSKAPTEVTDIGPKVNGQYTAYFRHKFSVSNVSELTDISIDLRYDDGAVVHINEQEVNRIEMPTGTIYYDTPANGSTDDDKSITFSDSAGTLSEGDNILAVEVHQRTSTSSDLIFDLNLEATRVIGGSGPAIVNAGAYIPQTGTLVVNISPQGAINDGAQWRVDGGAWRNSGSEIVQDVGTHTVDFLSVSGWQKPSSVQVEVFDSTQAVVNRTYSPGQSAGLQINEFMADNDSRSTLGTLEPGEILDGDLMSSDWIEIYNNSGSTVDISNWYLTDEADQKTKWQFPSGMSALGNGDYLIVFASGKTEELNPGNYPYWDGTYYHTSFQLDKGGEYLGLIDSDGTTVIHEFNQYPDQEENFSYGLDGSDPSYFAEATPGAANTGEFVAFVEKPEVNIEGGCYETAIDVTLTCDTVGSTIRYTTDGTSPTATTGTLYTGSIHLDSLTAIIAKGFRTDFHPSKARIETYIFVQSGVVGFNSNLPIVVVDTMGLPLPHNKDTKPYIDCRIVIIDVDDVTGRAEITGPEHFAGIGQIKKRGESTYGQGHYGIEIQDEYGMDKEVSLLGMPAESDWILSFDVIDFTLLKNEISFKWFRDMGHYAPRQRFVEVYFNENDTGAISTGDRKGVFMLREKIKRDKNRVDIARMDTLHNAEPQVSGGYMVKNDKDDPCDILLGDYLEIASYGIGYDGGGKAILAEPDHLVVTGPQINWIVGYINEVHSVFWQNTGSSWYPGPGAKDSDYVDEASWIDHGIVEQIGNDADAFWGSYFTHKDRGGKVFSGPPWDFDRAFHNSAESFGRSYTVWRQQGEIFGKWHQKLQDHLEYKMTLADRWFEHREVVLNTALTQAYIDQQVVLLTEAMSLSQQKTYAGVRDWEDNLAEFKDWITNRLDWLDGEIASRFAEAPPIFSPVGGYVSQGSSVSMSDPSGLSGPIYYTLNGEDPRLEGGGTNSNAVAYGGPVTLSKSTCVKARTKDGGGWSAMNTEVYAVGPVLENLRITELMYHPTDPTPGEIAALNPDPIDEDFEFIELKNIGVVAINLNLVHFTDGIHFTFGDFTLAAGDYAVLVKNQAAFAERYSTGGINIVPGSYVGYLDNGGEEIVLRDAFGAEIHDFDYNDSWYGITDGGGFSLTIKDASATDPNLWDRKAGWRPSAAVDGSPGVDDTGIIPEIGAIVINEILAHTDSYPNDWIELHNTTGSLINIGDWYLSDDDLDLMKYKIAPGTSIAAGGYIVFTQDDDFGGAFALSENGETLYLHSGDGSGLTGYSKEESFGASENSVAFGRYEKSTGTFNFVAMSANTPGGSYEGAANAYPKVGPIVINEIMYHPQINEDAEYVELKNISGSSVTLYDFSTSEPWQFIDDAGDPTPGLEFYFPTGSPVTMADGEYLLLVKNLAAFNSEFTPEPGVTILEWTTGGLKNSGEEPLLSMPGDLDGSVRQYIRVDKVNYSDGDNPPGDDPWPTEPDGENGDGSSLSRKVLADYGNDVANWQAASPTPGTINP